MKIPKKLKREFIPENLNLSSWEEIKPYFEKLKNYEINSLEDLKKFLQNYSEIESILGEGVAWRYIRTMINTSDKSLSEDYQKFINTIIPPSFKYYNEFNKKITNSEYLNFLNKEKYKIFVRSLKKKIEIYREENVPIFIKLEELAQKYSKIIGSMQIEHNSKNLTIQQANKLLSYTDRNLRNEIYHKIYARILKDKNKINDLLDEMIKLRVKITENTEYENYINYRFDEYERFDYTPDDCKNLHDSIASVIIPFMDLVYERKRRKLKLDKLKPWDQSVDEDGEEPLKPFETVEELIEKSTSILGKIHPLFADVLKTMNKMGHLDLDSKEGKAPGGFNYHLRETGVPFIFMNAVGTHRNLETLMHETGHAIHSVLTHDLELLNFKDYPHEIAELASMSMELMTMDYWNEIYNDDDFKRAKREKLESSLLGLLWISEIDAFQYWLYENPQHSAIERENKWNSLMSKFWTSVLDWSGEEDTKKIIWQKVPHIFRTPFYMIEYVLAQLGAIAIYKNFKKDKEKTISQYIAALKLGNTKTIPEVYKTAGIKFDFSKEYIKELVDFLQEELKELE